MTLNHQVIIPLFNLYVNENIIFKIPNENFIEQLTFHRFPKPIPFGSGNPDPIGNKPIPHPLIKPDTTIYIKPWGTGNTKSEDINHKLPTNNLPDDFDVFDNLGEYAFRASSGGLGGFQTTTTSRTKRNASALLIIEMITNSNDKSLYGQINCYESNIIESFLDAIRLYYCKNPNQHKGYHFENNKFVDSIIKWPLTEIQGQPVEVEVNQINKVSNIFFKIWKIRSQSRECGSCAIINIALEYYYLSSTMTETRTIFLYLMISFEALFKKEEETPASQASAIMARLISRTKSEYNDIHSFMWGTKETPGCSQIRNQIVHGNINSLNKNIFWRLKNLIRVSILVTSDLILNKAVDTNNLYESLDLLSRERFNNLPNN